MADRKAQRAGGYRFEHAEAVFDGSVRIEGVAAQFETAAPGIGHPPPNDPARVRRPNYALTCYVRMFDGVTVPGPADLPELRGLPNTGNGIEKPADVAGRTVGEFALYGHARGMWPEGNLSDEYGVPSPSAAGSSATSTTPNPVARLIRKRCPAGWTSGTAAQGPDAERDARDR